MTAIAVRNISKRYHLGDRLPNSLRDLAAKVFHRSSGGKDEFWALKDLSFDVSEGDTLGIIGRNGAGKSTLLKILSRITKPTSGSAKIYGRVGSLLEVGTGFHNELTGRENIFMNGAILGMKRTEIARKFDEIVAFSEIEQFLDTPVKHYSSGMYMRLAFSVAAHLEPEILIVDEVLAVGDVEFQKKCLGKMDEVSRSGRTVLFVSHNLGSLAQICSKGMLLREGELQFYGGIHDAIQRYTNANGTAGHYVLPADSGGLDMQITEARVSNSTGTNVTEVASDLGFNLHFRVRATNIARGAMFCVAMLNKNKERIFTEHKRLEEFVPQQADPVEVTYTIPKGLIAPNSYSFLLQIFLPSGEIIQNISDICPITIIDSGTDMAPYNDYGYLQMEGGWGIR